MGGLRDVSNEVVARIGESGGSAMAGKRGRGLRSGREECLRFFIIH